MISPSGAAIWRARRRLLRLLTREVAVLLYHRVTEVASDPWSLAVTTAHFAEHLEVVRRRARTMTLTQLAQALRGGTLPRRGVVITFDDGYADNLRNAKPLLVRHETPATVFVASGALDSEREFWWDELDRLLLPPAVLPAELKLSIAGVTYTWRLEGTEGEADPTAPVQLPLTRPNDAPTSRRALYHSLWRLLHPLTRTAQQRVLDELRGWARGPAAGRPSHRTLSSDELIELASGGLIEVGAHTVSHPVLSRLPVLSQREEIQRSKVRLEEILGHPVDSFAYPYGNPGDYTPETVRLVREAGFRSACSNVSATVRSSADLFQLPRIHVKDCDGDQFAGRLRYWLP